MATFVFSLLLALGLDLLLMFFCYVMVSLLMVLGYALYYYRGSGKFLPIGTSDLKLWRQGFHRSVKTPAGMEPTGYYVLRDREGMQLTLRHKLLLLALALAWSSTFLLLILGVTHIVQIGDLALLRVRLVPALLLLLAVSLVWAWWLYASIRKLRANVRPRRIFMNNVGAWLEKYDASDMVMGLSFFHSVQRLLSPEELEEVVDTVSDVEERGDPERGKALIQSFFLRLDQKSDTSGRPWLFELTQEGVEEYQKLRLLIWPPESRGDQHI